MQQYKNLLSRILDNGEDHPNERTQTTCRTLIAAQLEFNLNDGFPLVTLRKMPFKSLRGELLGFFRGYTSAEDFRALGCKFWDANANQTKAWLDNPFRKGEDDLGRIYSDLWTAWPATHMLPVSGSKRRGSYLQSKGYDAIGKANLPNEETYGVSEHVVLHRNINQLEELVRGIITDPTSRRLIINGWNPSVSEQQCLPDCHMSYNFIAEPKTRRLSVVMGMRSTDAYLGLPCNIASTALLLMVVARLTGYTAKHVVLQCANVHLYENSWEAASEIVQREPMPLPSVTLSDAIAPITKLSQIPGCFSRIEPDDITLHDYQSHEALSVPMVA